MQITVTNVALKPPKTRGGGGRQKTSLKQIAKNAFEATCYGVDVTDADMLAHKVEGHKSPYIFWNTSNEPTTLNEQEVPGKHLCYGDGTVIGEWSPTDCALMEQLPEVDDSQRDEDGNPLVSGWAVSADFLSSFNYDVKSQDPKRREKEIARVEGVLSTLGARLSSPQLNDEANAFHIDGTRVTFKLKRMADDDSTFVIYKTKRGAPKRGKGKRKAV